MSGASLPRSRHIFVVDDEAAARDMVGDYLALQGFTVTLCDGGRSLRAALSAQTPDLVLVDLNMPEEDGLSIIRFLKQSTSAAVILLTATASPIDRVVGLEIGADDYLTKPCELRELLARIRSVLRRVYQPSGPVDERRLAAIVSFDQVGFSRAIQHDEAGTLAAMDRVFVDLIDPSLPRHRGVLFKKLGDGALIDFASAVDAVEWSTNFQRALLEHPVPLKEPSGLSFRLGIAIGDVVFAQGDRLGEGVALAVRIQEMARPGTVTLSSFAHRLVRSRVGLAFHNLGHCTLKHIAEPMRLYEWSPDREP